MKLTDKYNRINLVSTIVIFLLSGVAFYFALHYTLITQLDEDLKVEQKEITDYVNENGVLPQAELVGDQQINFVLLAQPAATNKFETVVSLNNNQKRRQLTFSVKAGNKWYDAVVSKSLERTDNILRSVVLITLSTIILILTATFITSRLILKKLWQPFYASLNKVREFKIGSKLSLQLEASNIDEFNAMNATLLKSTNKASEDYMSLKQFTENASHELQTPLSIIRSKLEILLQDEHLSETQSIAAQSANEAINRLARLNQSLLLLTKIENEQFAEKSTINLRQAVENKIQQFKEIWDTRQIQLSLHLNETSILINPELLELLLNNLFSNAVKHNYNNGQIEIRLVADKLTISNTGDKKPLSEQHLFKRFYNPDKNSNSNGLGLAIIKQICDASCMRIFYVYTNQQHVFKIIFIY